MAYYDKFIVIFLDFMSLMERLHGAFLGNRAALKSLSGEVKRS